jgi:hypothetical protein
MADYLMMCKKKNDELKNAMEEIERLKKENKHMDATISCAIEDIETCIMLTCSESDKERFESILALMKGDK